MSTTSTNGTHTHSFTPTAPELRVVFSASSAFSLAGISLLGQHTDTIVKELPTRLAYRYGFQGQEKDDEIKGVGNSINFEYRMHDPRIGRFFAIDPLATRYPHWSPYVFSGNQVIRTVELEGLEPDENLNANEAEVSHELEGVSIEFNRGKPGDMIAFSSYGAKYQQITINSAIEGSKIVKPEIKYDLEIKISKSSEMGELMIEKLEQKHGINFKTLTRKEKKDFLSIKWSDSPGRNERGGIIMDRSDLFYIKLPTVIEINVIALPVNIVTSYPIILPINSSSAIGSRGGAVLDLNYAASVLVGDFVNSYRKAKSSSDSEYNQEAEHTSGARKSTEQKHQRGQARKGRDKGGEKGDARRTRYK